MSKPRLEIVLSAGTKLSARTREGLITILAKNHLQRTFIWNGCERTITLWPREKRWGGSLGAYFPGAGTNWRICDGLDRAMVEEGEQHFKTLHEALLWIHSQTHLDFVYTDDGLMLGWKRDLPTKSLIVELWQIIIAGSKPAQLQGSNIENISVSHFHPDHDGLDSELIRAVESKDKTQVEELLKRGADPNSTTNNETTALMVAAIDGPIEIMEILLKTGARANETDLDGMTALLYATIANNNEKVKILLRSGADPNRADTDGMTPLMYASLGGQLEVVELLLANGADSNLHDLNGTTSLMHAANKGRFETVKMLLRKGASVKIKDKQGATALDYAAAYPDIVRLLKNSL